MSTATATKTSSSGLSFLGALLARHKWTTAGGLLTVGILISISFFFLVRANERRDHQWQFEREAEQLGRVVEVHFRYPLEIVPALAAFFESSDTVTRQEFDNFVQGALRRHRGIYSFEWIPLVPADQRAAFEESARADGIADFKFQEIGPNGQLQTASAAPEYMPIYFQVPPGPALGLDVATAQTRDTAIGARNSDDLVVSDRFYLVEAPDREPAVVFYQPVHRRNSGAEESPECRGLVSLVLLVNPIMNKVLAETPMRGIDAVLTDESADEGHRLLMASSPQALARIGQARLVWTKPFHLGARTWALTVGAQPRSSWVSTSFPSLTLTAGIALAALCAAAWLALSTILGLQSRVARATQLGQYRLEEKIGEGGMGEVYRATHAMLRRPTAVKLLPPEKNSQVALARFEREVQLTSQLTHPNTIIVFDYGRTEDNVLYYAMEYLDGVNLDFVVERDGPQPAGRVIHILRHVCGSLQEAHLASLIHRDIKPANIMLCRQGGQFDVVKVLDFGLAKDMDAVIDPEITMRGSLPGTPLYTSPEAVLGTHPVDARSDLYALGAVGYYLLTGQHVFTTHSLIELLNAHAEALPTRPSQRLGRQIAADLEQVILRCLAKDPADRPQSAHQLADWLGTCADALAWTQPQARAWWLTFNPDKCPPRAASDTEPTLGSIRCRLIR
jgi:CHASE1-domain containing sensor protein